MTDLEMKRIYNLADILQGEINRMCVTRELSELDTMYAHAKRNLYILWTNIYHSKFSGGGV